MILFFFFQIYMRAYIFICTLEVAIHLWWVAKLRFLFSVRFKELIERLGESTILQSEEKQILKEFINFKRPF